jgi:hypothetical protein
MLRYWLLAILVPALVLTSACEATGKGTIQSSSLSNHAKAARFKFDFISTLNPGATISSSFKGQYKDKDGQLPNGQPISVHLKGTGLMKSSKSKGSTPTGGCMFGAPGYESLNPDFPGTGLLELLVCDGGPGSTNDYFSISVLDGPYASYQNAGTVLKGDITVYLH